MQEAMSSGPAKACEQSGSAALTYADAGVDIEEGARAVDAIKA